MSRKRCGDRRHSTAPFLPAFFIVPLVLFYWWYLFPSLGQPKYVTPSPDDGPLTDSTTTLAFEDWSDKTELPCPAISPTYPTVLVVFKTGNTESGARVPVHLETDLACVPSTDLLIFSDAPETMANHTIHDALAHIPPSIMDGNPDFDLYRAQRACVGLDPPEREACRRRLRPTVDDAQEGRDAWALDKYKFVHLLADAWRMRPASRRYDWVVFMEADTYLVWRNLLGWLARLDPKRRLYMGQRMRWGPYVGERLRTFAHGGSGYVLSAALWEELVGGPRGEELTALWDPRTAMGERCCGDMIIAEVVLEAAGIRTQDTWPLTSGGRPHEVLFQPDLWCTPVVTQHHVSATEMPRLSAFERAHYLARPANDTRPLLFRDLFRGYFPANATAPLHTGSGAREDWDNFSAETWWVQPRTASECAARCAASTSCFQWRFGDNRCTWARGFAVGASAKTSGVVSGWDAAKVRAMMDAMGECVEDEIRWPDVPGQTPAPKRTINSSPFWDWVADVHW